MDIFSVKDFAKYYLKLWYLSMEREPESIDELMSVDMKAGENPLMNSIIIMFGIHKGKGMWETPKDYRNWLTEQVRFYLKTHSWSKGLS